MDNVDLKKYLAEGKLYKTEEQLLEEGLVDVFNKAKDFIMKRGQQFYDHLKSKLSILFYFLSSAIEAFLYSETSFFMSPKCLRARP